MDLVGGLWLSGGAHPPGWGGEQGWLGVGEEERFLYFLYSWKSCSLSLLIFGEAKNGDGMGLRGQL